MSHGTNLRDGEVTELKRILYAHFSAEDLRKVIRYPDVAEVMYKAAMQDPAFRLVHGRFTKLADKIAMVKSWPGVKPADVDAAFEAAKADGTIAGFEAESPRNHLLDIVIVVYLATLWETLLYARERMRETWGEDKYNEWEAVYAQGVDENRIKAIVGAKPFVPNRIVIEVVDFGANWNPKDGTVLAEVQKTQADQLADFAGIYNASESPKWVEQMDGKKVPYSIAAALLFNIPDFSGWFDSPGVWLNEVGARLSGACVDDRFHKDAMPVRKVFKKY